MKKLDKKGFSLVELIIVIAIMAVLIGILAPQYLKYVEKSRIEKARSNADVIANAITALLVDEAANHGEYYDSIVAGCTLKLDGTESTNAPLANAILGQIGTNEIDGTITFQANADDIPTFTYEMIDGKYGVDYPIELDGRDYINTGNNTKFHVYRK